MSCITSISTDVGTETAATDVKQRKRGGMGVGGGMEGVLGGGELVIGILERENSKWKHLFYNDCILGSVKKN